MVKGRRATERRNKVAQGVSPGSGRTTLFSLVFGLERPGTGLSKFFSPLPWGEGGERSEPGEGSLIYPAPNPSPRHRELLLRVTHEPLRVVPHQAIRNPRQAYADGSEAILLCSVSPHLTWLRVNATTKLNGQATFEAIETVKSLDN
jgi:hypothetical protein